MPVSSLGGLGGNNARQHHKIWTRFTGTFLQASFLPSGSSSTGPEGSLPTCTAFRQPDLFAAYNSIIFQGAVCVYITLIYILTWFKSTPLSAIIITHLLQGSTQFFLHLRRAAAGVAHRRPANTPPALPGIQTASAYTHSHCLS